MQFKNKLLGQTLVGDNNDYSKFLLINCKVIGNNNEIGGMLRGSLIGNNNEVNYLCGASFIGNNNEIQNSFDIEEEQKKIEEEKYSELPDQIRVAMLIKDKAIEVEKMSYAGVAEVNKMKNEYFKMYGSPLESMIAWAKGFTK